MSLTLPFRGLSARSTLFSNPILVQTHSFVIPRKTREITRATDTVHDDTNIAAQAANNNRMGQITDILDNAALSHSPSSSNFSAGAKFERTRRGRLPKDQRFLKPTDLLHREDPFRRKRALLGPGAAQSRENDWFYQLDIDPLNEATNPRLLSYFVTDMGKVKGRAQTKLTWRNQRRLTKAIRRAKMMGVMPIFNKHTPLFRDVAHV